MIRSYETNSVWGVVLAAAIIFAALFLAPDNSFSSDEKLRAPLKTKEVVNAIEQVEWQQLSQGLRSVRVLTPQGLLLNAFEISPEHFEFDVVVQKQKTGDWVKDVVEREGVLIATNAGFFAERSSGELYSVGYLKTDGKVLSRAWKSSGGYIDFTENGPALSPSGDGVPNGAGDILQTKPMMIEPGGLWAMRSNEGLLKHRSILCRKASGEVILATVTRGGISLYEAGWLMRSKSVGGYFDCDSAIALDGGRSTQMWYAGQPEISYPGLTPVHNFLLVKPKS